MRIAATAWAALMALPSLAAAEDAALNLEDVVVTAPRMGQPLKVVTDPKAPRQPMPAHDGADYLKTIPGFSIIRKGGSDGDPVFRGMAGSHLNILLDGEQILGGCGGRMDPPTAYVFPETYDRITLLKGPQTVLYGPGNSAGTVLFERSRERQSGAHGHGSLMVGSYGRNDELIQLRGGSEPLFVEGSGSRSHAGDYEDGNGNKAHSRYTRWSEGIRLGLTPDADTRLEFSGLRSDGEAAYADRTVDGSRFARRNAGVKFAREHISPLLAKVEARLYYSTIDHVMDNYHLRDFVPSVMSPQPAAMNPDRTTRGGRTAVQLDLGAATKLNLGADWQGNDHSNRMSMMQWTMPYQAMDRQPDARFRNVGLFSELAHDLANHDRLIGGLRLDRWHAEDKRRAIALTMMSAVANPTAGAERDRTLSSGFARYEHDLAAMPATLYAGLGHSERAPDYWELFNKESAVSASAFATTDSEKTTQLDLGAVVDMGRLSWSVSGFANRIDDYILIQSGVAKGAGMSARSATIVRNVDATTWGGELGAAYRLAGAWKLDGSLA